MAVYYSSLLLLASLLITLFSSHTTSFPYQVTIRNRHLYEHVGLHSHSNNNHHHHDVKQSKQRIQPLTFMNRKDICRYIFAPTTATFISLLSTNSDKALAATTTTTSISSSTSYYPIQKTEEEWADILSPKQYNILRKGGTERPNSSILEEESRLGTYKCAACHTPLFSSKDKFHSGTGWPSFASALDDGVDIDQVSEFQASLLGAGLKCKGCGGHLGDVFNDGYRFVGTPAYTSGKRFCIDGYALVFQTKSKFGVEEVRGDA